MHLRDGLRHVGRPGAQPLQQLHAAQRQRQRARIAGQVLAGRAGVEQRDARLRQAPGGLQREGQARRPGADHGDVKKTLHGGRIIRCAPSPRGVSHEFSQGALP